MTCRHNSIGLGKYASYCLDCGAALPDPLAMPGPVDPWLKVGETHPPACAAYYAAWYSRSMGSWHVVRVGKGCTPPPSATHWRDDVLGLPASP